MNKTLLIILVDFLLLTILSLTEWDKERKEQEANASDASSEESVAAMAIMEQDLLDTLQSSLEEERVAQETLNEEAEQTAQELAAAEQRIKERDDSIGELQSDLSEAEKRELALQREKQNLQDLQKGLEEEKSQVEQGLEEMQQLYTDVEAKARQSEAQSRRLQEELNRKLQEIEAKESELAKAAEEQKASAARIQELDVQVKVAESEKRFLTGRVSELSEEVELERQEKRVLQEQAGKLAEGVTQLAEQSQDLREELRSSIPINANQLFDQFRSKMIEANFSYLRAARSRVTESTVSANSVLVSDGVDTYALLHMEHTPYNLGQSVSLLKGTKGSLNLPRGQREVDTLSVLSLDPRVVVAPLSQEEATASKASVYLTALEPFKFPEAVLISGGSGKYGEVEFKLDLETPGYVKMQSKILSSLFGEFSPSKGDLVLSMTGELLGIMVNRRYCVLVDNFVVSQKIGVGANYDPDDLERVLESLEFQYDSLEDVLR
ncbi:MAG: hypothetical protein AAGB46_16635 [Verrucomicrobiota bacterium]